MINNNYYANVSVWNPNCKEGRCGHTTITLLKEGEDGKLVNQRHIGLWPKHGWKVNLFTLWMPVLATSTVNLTQDMIREGTNEEPLSNSHSYKIPVNEEQYINMQNIIDSEMGRINNGHLLYSLTPRVSILNFLKLFSQPIVLDYIHRCPVSDQAMEDSQLKVDCKDLNKITVENCSTIVTTVLNAGEIEIKPTYLVPWTQSPFGVNFNLGELAKKRFDIERTVSLDNSNVKRHHFTDFSAKKNLDE